MNWRCSDDFVCVKLGGQDYLLPYGQKIVDYYSGLILNESGALLWNAMRDGADEEELLKLLCTHYQAVEDDIFLLKQDLADFLNRLEKRKAARPVQSEVVSHRPFLPGFFQAGSLRIAYEGPELVYDTYFKKFACGEGEADQRVEIRFGHPAETRNGQVLVRSAEFILMEREEIYIMLFPAFPDIHEMQVTKDGSQCFLYCTARMSKREQEDIFHAMRFAFLILAQNRDLSVVHSASLLYRDRAWLFSGRSGTGKSTHTNLWSELCGAERINGDLNCLGLRGEEVWVYGLPWCGTSGIATPEAYPLGGIVFLKQWRENLIQELTEAEKACSLSMRMITPTWTAELLEKNLRLAEKIASRCMVTRLCCTKEPESAAVMREYIDRYLGERKSTGKTDRVSG